MTDENTKDETSDTANGKETWSMLSGMLGMLNGAMNMYVKYSALAQRSDEEKKVDQDSELDRFLELCKVKKDHSNVEETLKVLTNQLLYLWCKVNIQASKQENLSRGVQRLAEATEDAISVLENRSEILRKRIHLNARRYNFHLKHMHDFKTRPVGLPKPRYNSWERRGYRT